MQERDESNNNQDSEMADISQAPSDDDDDGEEGDDGEDGDEGADDDQDENEPPENANVQEQDNEMGGPSPPAEQGAEETTESDAMTDDEQQPASKRSVPPVPNPLNLAPPTTALFSPRLEGSPLKNVVLPSPTDPSPHTSPVAASFAPLAAVSSGR